MSRRVRRLIPLAAALVVLVPAGIAAAAATDPQIKIDPVDQAWADSIVLRSADLGKGWKIDRTGGVAGGDESSGDSTWCPEGTPSEPDLTITGGSASPGFKRKDDSSVSSYAFVWQTAEQAQADWERTQATMTALIDCFASLFETASTHAVKASVTAKGVVPIPAVAPRTAAYRIKVLFKPGVRGKKTKKKSPPWVVSMDFILLGNGRTSVFVLINSAGSRAFSPAFEQSLAARLAARMIQDPAATPAP